MNDKLNLLRSICRENKLRITPQRTAIYESVCKLRAHHTTEQVYSRVKKVHPSISLNTVNETLLTFAKIGLLEPVEGFGGPRRFEPNLDSHHHAHCIECGTILDFNDKCYKDLTTPAKIKRDFHIISTKVVVTGICKKCKTKT